MRFVFYPLFGCDVLITRAIRGLLFEFACARQGVRGVDATEERTVHSSDSTMTAC